LYAGITTGPARRLARHARGGAAKYTRGRRPLRLVYLEEHADRAAASRRELDLKNLTRAEKCQLILAQTTVSAINARMCGIVHGELSRTRLERN
jgi:putative endonuclease